MAGSTRRCRCAGSTCTRSRRPRVTPDNSTSCASSWMAPPGSTGELVDVDLAQLALEDFSGRIAWQLVEEHHFPRHLVAGEVVTHIVLDGVLVQAGVLLFHHECAQPVAPLFILDADR